jgi:UDP-N-acetylmuramoylalanine--D-glutamate ligase
MSSQQVQHALSALKNKKIALLGYGLDNQALFNFLKSRKLNTDITIKDFRLDPTGFNKNLEEFDILFRSPGWPLLCPGVQKAKQGRQTEISSPLNLFLSLCPSQKIIGVTGTKGKGTTATLIYKILKDAGHRAWLGGNIGISPLSFLDKIKPNDFIVLELSSFQLEDLKYSPRWSIITNLFPEHLAPADPNNPNFHASLAKYWQAKLNIGRYADNKYLIVNRQLETKLKKYKLPGKTIYFSASSLPSRLAGEYNQDNIGAAVALARILKIPEKQFAKTIARFSNLEHRLELVRTVKGVKYYDNSFATTPESTILDLRSFPEPLIQIAGGADKGASFTALAKEIKRKVKCLILLPGQATPRLKKELLKNKLPLDRLLEASDMEQAVSLASQQATAGDVVLLSTACASFGIFKNYKERGNLFKKYVRQIKAR